jgi:hypothetical protein
MTRPELDLLDGAVWETTSGMPARWTPPEQRDPRQVQAEQEAHERWVRTRRRVHG